MTFSLSQQAMLSTPSWCKETLATTHAALASTTLGGVRLLKDKAEKRRNARVRRERKKGRREYQSFSRLFVVVSAYFRIFVQPCSVFFRHSKGLFHLGDFRFNRQGLPPGSTCSSVRMVQNVHDGIRIKIFVCLTKFLAYDKTLPDAKNILERSSEGVWFYNAVVMKTLHFQRIALHFYSTTLAHLHLLDKTKELLARAITVTLHESNSFTKPAEKL